MDAAERVVHAPVIDYVTMGIRPRWVRFVLLLAIVVSFFRFDTTAVPDSLYRALGLVLLLVGIFNISPRNLVRTPNNLLLTNASKWTNRPKSLVGTVEPSSIRIFGGFINRRIVVGEDTYRMFRTCEKRLRAMLDGLPAVPPDVPPGYVRYQG